MAGCGEAVGDFLNVKAISETMIYIGEYRECIYMHMCMSVQRENILGI